MHLLVQLGFVAGAMAFAAEGRSEG